MNYRAGMFVYALAFLLGVVFVQQLSVLPDNFTLKLLSCLAVVCIVALAFFVLKKAHALTSCFALIIVFNLLFILGLLYASVYAKQQLSYRLDNTMAGQNIVVNGYISNIPVATDKGQTFEFDIDSFRFIDDQHIDDQPADGESPDNRVTLQPKDYFPKKIRLSWYYGLPVHAGEVWQLQVRLKPPHGFMNPGGFDYEAWLFQHGVHATGYVRKSSLNQLHQSVDKSQTVSMAGVNRLRQLLIAKIDLLNDKYSTHADENSYSLIKALAVGDKSSISKGQWRVLANTGTSHLMAISGLHIGLAMLFAYVLIRRLLPVWLIKRIPAQHIAVTGGAVAALAYALIAGLSIPTQRAIIMLFVLSVMMLIRRNHRPVDALGLAAFVVLLFDPLAVLSVGFWFSFSAVAVIFISVETGAEQTSGSQQDISFLTRLRKILLKWVRLQLLISLFLLPLSLFMFQQVSLVSPLANLLLIPYVSFLVVPVVLLAIVCSYLLPFLAELLFQLAAALLDFVWSFLSFLSQLPFALWVQGDVSIVKLLLATVAMLLIFYSAELGALAGRYFKRHAHHVYRWMFRFCALLLCLPLFIISRSTLKTGEYQLAVLDVGQGSAAVIQTSNHVAVLDSGAKFSEKLDAGSSVVIPYLRSRGVRSLDQLIISHGDSDHIGGAQAILDEFPESSVIGQDIDNLKVKNKQLCVAGQKWRWDGVDFLMLSPGDDAKWTNTKVKRNDRSCVLRVSSAAGVALFTGDIEKKTELYLLENFAGQLASDILIVPHHGSNTSSSVPFIELVRPKISVISAGYKNRYKLPSAKVTARYEQLDSELMNTAKSGAITIKMGLTDGVSVKRHRQQAKRYWYHLID